MKGQDFAVWRCLNSVTVRTQVEGFDRLGGGYFHGDRPREGEMSITDVHIRAHRIDRNAVDLDGKKVQVCTVTVSAGIGDDFGPARLTDKSELQQADNSARQDFRHVNHKSIHLSVQGESYKLDSIISNFSKCVFEAWEESRNVMTEWRRQLEPPPVDVPSRPRPAIPRQVALQQNPPPFHRLVVSLFITRAKSSDIVIGVRLSILNKERSALGRMHYI